MSTTTISSWQTACESWKNDMEILWGVRLTKVLGAGRASFSKIQILNMSVDISLDISKLGLTEIFTAITSIFNILFFVDLIEYNSNNKITCKYLHYILNFWHKICQH